MSASYLSIKKKLSHSFSSSYSCSMFHLQNCLKALIRRIFICLEKGQYGCGQIQNFSLTSNLTKNKAKTQKVYYYKNCFLLGLHQFLCFCYILFLLTATANCMILCLSYFSMTITFLGSLMYIVCSYKLFVLPSWVLATFFKNRYP